MRRGEYPSEHRLVSPVPELSVKKVFLRLFRSYFARKLGKRKWELQRYLVQAFTELRKDLPTSWFSFLCPTQPLSRLVPVRGDLRSFPVKKGFATTKDGNDSLTVRRTENPIFAFGDCLRCFIFRFRKKQSGNFYFKKM